MDLSLLTEADLAILQELIDERKRRLANTPSRPPSEHTWSEGEDHQSPEVYVAYPQDDPDADANYGTGTGTGTGWRRPPGLIIPGVTIADTADTCDEPGKANCNIYQMVPEGTAGDLTVCPVGGWDATKDEYFKPVYNVGPVSIVNAYTMAIRDKYGRWFAVPQQGLSYCMLAENHPGRGVPFKVWPGVWCPEEAKYRFNCNDVDDTWDAIDWFYGGAAYVYPDQYAQTWFQPMPYKYGRDGIVYASVAGDCDSDASCGDHALPCTDEDRA